MTKKMLEEENKEHLRMLKKLQEEIDQQNKILTALNTYLKCTVEKSLDALVILKNEINKATLEDDPYWTVLGE